MDVGEFTVRSGPATLFTANARAGRLTGKDQPVKAQGQWRADLPALLAQPAAQGLAQLAGGSAQATSPPVSMRRRRSTRSSHCAI